MYKVIDTFDGFEDIIGTYDTFDDFNSHTREGVTLHIDIKRVTRTTWGTIVSLFKRCQSIICCILAFTQCFFCEVHGNFRTLRVR